MIFLIEILSVNIHEMFSDAEFGLRGGVPLTGIKCPHCRGSLALDRIGVHFQKFCSAIPTAMAREASMKKYNRFYTHLQSHSRGEMTIEELQTEANKLFRVG